MTRLKTTSRSLNRWFISTDSTTRAADTSTNEQRRQVPRLPPLRPCDEELDSRNTVDLHIRHLRDRPQAHAEQQRERRKRDDQAEGVPPAQTHRDEVRDVE